MLLALAAAAHAQQDRNWDANGTAFGNGGIGIWDITAVTWSPNADGVSGPYGAWDNLALDNAIFGGTAGTVTLGAPITVHNLTFVVNGYTITGGTLTLGGIAPTINTGNGAVTQTINSILAGSAGLTKAGTGTLTLNGANTFTGDVNINVGNLSVAGDAALGDAANVVNLAGGARLTATGLLSSSRVVNLAGGEGQLAGAGVGSARITGAGGVAVLAGVTMSNAASNYTGLTHFFVDGPASFNSVGNVGEASSLGAGNTIRVTGVNAFQDTLSYTGAGNTSNRDWVFDQAGGSSVTNLYNQGTGTLTLSGTLSSTAAATSPLHFGAISADLDLQGVISSASNRLMAFSGGGVNRTITLGGANTYAGATLIGNTGAVTVRAQSLADTGTASSFGTGASGGITVRIGSVLDYIGDGDSSNRSWTIDNASLLNDGTGALTLSGTVSTANNVTLGGSYSGSDNTISGVISGTGNLIGTGAGTWVLSGANTRSGAVTVQSGTLRGTNASAFGTVTGVTVNGSGTLDTGGFDLNASSLAGTGGTIALGAGDLILNAAAGSTSYAGSITGSGGLTKNGGSTQTLSGTNTYTGPTTVNGGALVLDFAAAGGPTSDIISGASTLNMGGGALTITGAVGETNVQNFNGLNVSAGNNRIHATSGVGGSTTVNFGAINRTGGLLDLGLASAGTMTTTNPDGALGGWATINGTDYAQVVGGVITAFTAYANKDDAGTWLTGEFISDAGGAANTPYIGTVSSSQQLSGLQYTAAAASTVTVASGQALGVDGTIIVSSTVGASAKTITGGSLTGTAGGGVLGIQQNSGGTFTIASQIVDNGGSIGFTKAGTGLVTLSNTTNNYTGATIVSQGILSVNNIVNGGVASSIGASSAASSNLFLEGGTLRYTGGTTSSDRGFTLAKSGAILGGTIDVTAAATNLTFSGLVTSPDDAGFTKTGLGTLALANAGNDYVGVTTVSQGTLSVSTLADGGVASGIGASTSASTNLVLAGGTLQYTGATVSSDRGFTLGPGTGGIDVNNAASTLTLSGTAVGTGSLTKTGAGTLVLSGTNTYTGGTTISAGTLRLGSAQAFGTGLMTLANTGGATLDLNGFNTTFSALQGGGPSGGNVALGAATLTLSGGTGTYAGVISGTGGLTRTSAGTQTMSGCNNTYTGGTTINGSTLSVDCLANGGVASGIGASAGASTNLALIAGALNYTGGSVSTNRGFTLQGNNTITVTNAATTLEFSGAATNGAAGGNFIKAGAGTLVFSGTNTYVGTTITAGILRAGSTSAFGTGGMLLSNAAGATLDLNGFSNAVAFLAGGGTTGGSVTLGSATLTISNPGDQNYAGGISGSGSLVKSGAGRQQLSGCNSSYAGSTTINGGTLWVNCLTDGGSNSAIGASSNAASNLVLNGGALQYTGAAASTDRQFTLGTAGGTLSADGTGAVAFTSTGPITLTGTNTARTFTLTGSNTDNNSLGAQITNNGTGATALTKTGVGTWILTDLNSTYTGITTISGGVLGVDKLSDGGVASSIGASSAAAANLVIGSGSTLRYTGSGDTTNRLFTLAAGVSFIESSGTGAIVFTDTGPVTLQTNNAARTIALGGTNAGNNTLAGSIGNAGTGVTTLAKNDAGTWVLTGNSTYTGPTNINAGTLFIGGGGTTGSITSTTVNDFGTLGFNRSDAIGYSGLITGTGAVMQVGTGMTTLTGNNTYTGATTVNAGTLRINGNQSAAIGVTSVLSGATLGGSGTIGGTVLVANSGHLAPGNSPGTLTIAGDLLLNGGSVLDFELGQANTPGGPFNDLINVGGNLTLDGTLNVAVSAGGTFGPGLYRVINYGGALTDNGLALGTMPPGTTSFVQTSVANQVNLVSTTGLTLNYWDGNAGPKFNGAVNGGSGQWQSPNGNDNWTEVSGALNAAYTDNSFAVFQAASGTVTVDNSLGAVTAAGMQFASNGYVITGGPLTLNGPQSIVRVGDGTAAGASMTATIVATLSGATQLAKTDLGTLVLTGVNTYTGGTFIDDGTLQVSSDANLGAAAAGLTFDGGTLRTTASFGSARTIALSGAGTVLTDPGTTLTLSGLASGLGVLTKDGAGTLQLTADNTYTGGTTIAAGTLQLGTGGTTGAIVGNVLNNGVLAFNRSNTLTFGGTLSGTGALNQIGTGTTILTGANSYTGGTTIAAGTLQIGNGGTTGAIVGNVADNGLLAFNRSDSVTFTSLISGTGALSQIGSGTTVLSGNNSYTGATTVDAGTLLIDGNQSGATGLVTVNAGAALGGSGTIGGDVAIASGAALAPGSNGIGTLTIDGNLTLASASTLNYEFGQSSVVGGPLNDLVQVGGNLLLDGTINVAVSPGGSFTGGVYRVASYGGALTNNGLTAGIMPPGSAVIVQTSVAGQVNLVNTAGLTLNFWDGAAGPQNDSFVSGGNGLWQNSSGNDNWADATGAVNAAFTDGAFAIFSAAPGTVTVDNSLGAVTASGMQFVADGYTIAGGALTLNGPQSILRVGDGTAAGVGYTATIDSVLTGATQLVKTDLGTLILAGANTYTGGTLINTGTLRIASDANLGDAAGALSFDGGTLNTTADIASGRAVSLVSTGTFLTDAATTLTLNGVASGAGSLITNGSGSLVLAGNNSYTGTTTVTAGSLFVNGNQSAAIGLTTVNSGATLGGSGVIGGDVTMGDGATLAPGVNSVGTLTINGNLSLVSGSVLDFQFGQANVAGGSLNDLVSVGGNLVLDGSINVSVPAGGSFGPGIYRVFDYAGALTDNGLSVGTMPSGTVTVQTSVAGQVNLVNGSLVAMNFWDGAAGPKNDGRIDGGDGVWQSGGNDNWTSANGSTNGPYAPAAFAIFSATPGTVTVDDGLGVVTASGLQFASNGYVITGGALGLVGPQSIVRVGDGTAAGAGYTATIASSLTGATQLNKTDLGTLVLSGTNTYTGGTLISGGTLQISSDANLGAASGALTFDGGTLRTTADITSTRAVTINATGGTFDTASGSTLLINSVVSGGGALTKTGDGVLVLTADNSYSGGTLISAGTVEISSDANLGASSGGVTFNGGTLRTTADITASRAVTISEGGGTFDTVDGTTFLLESSAAGAGALTKVGTGSLVLTGDNTYTGGTTIQGGTLQLGNCGPSGSIVGDIVDNSVLIFSRTDTATYAGRISGSGSVIKNCSGTQVLRGANSYSGGTLIDAGTLIGDTQSLQGVIVDNAALVFDQDTDGTFHGVVGGAGTLDKTGSGTVLLTGDHPLQGQTTVQAGTLALDGTLSGAVRVLNGGTFDANGAIGGALNVDGTVTVRSKASGEFGLFGVLGDVSFNPGSHYGVAIDASGGNSALVTLGAARIDGATVDVNDRPGDYSRVTHYAILQADGGLRGRATASAAMNFDPILTQNSTTLFLTLLRTDLPLQPVSYTANGWGIGGAIDRLKVDATGDLADVTRELTALDDAALGQALDAVAGEIHASAMQLAAIDGESVMDVVRSEVGVRVWSRGSEPAAGAGAASAPWGSPGRRGWVRFRSERASFDADSSTNGQGGRSGAHGGDLSLDGFALGLDWTLAPNWLLGVGGSYATGSLTLDDLAERSDFSAPRGLVYVGYGRSRWAINSGFSLAHLGYETTRAFSFMAFGPTGAPLLGGVDRVATSSPSGVAAELWTEGRLDASLRAWDLQPTIGVRAARFGLGAWEETGADALSLTAPSQATHSVQADGGVRLSRALGRFRPYFGGMYRREVSAGRTTATLQLAEGAGGLFEIDGLSLAKDVGVAQAGVLLLQNRFSVLFGYEARRARQQTRHALQLAVGFE